MLLSFNDLNSKTLSFSDNPFRLRPMFIGKVTEQSSASSPTDQQEVDEEEDENEFFEDESFIAEKFRLNG